MSTDRDHRRDDAAPTPSTSPWLRRRRLAAGTAGLAAVLGAGAYVVTSEVIDEQTTAQEVRVATPVTTAPAPAPPGATPTASAQTSQAPVDESSPAPLSDEAVTEILEARRKMAEEGVDVKRPLKGATSANAASVKATTEGSLKTGGIVRMVTAREDLTGQRELAWVSGGIKKYRDVPCSQTIKVSTDTKPEKKDNLLICWRTSPKKSVISIVVDPDGKPSRAKAVDALEKEWRSMK